MSQLNNERNRCSGSTAWWALSAGAIGHALVISDGIYDRRALLWVGLGIVLAWMGFFWRETVQPAGEWVWAVCVAVLGWQIVESFTGPPPVLKNVPISYYAAALPLMAAAALGACLMRGQARGICLAALATVFFTTGAWLVHRAGKPPIDVYEVTTDACVAMEQGRNPYAIDFPDIYTDRPDWEKAFYPPGYVYNGRVHFGYQYMPLSLLVALGGQWSAGDYRFGNLAALAAAGALLGFCRPGRMSAVAAGLLLLTPRAYWVIQNGWAEPVVVMCLSLVVFCAMRRPGGLPYAAGLLLASKQHMLLAAPALLLVMRKPKEWLKAGVTAAAVTLPLVLWDARAFWHSAIDVQIVNPFRYDSLNFAAAWTRLGHAPPAGAIAFLLGIAAAGVVAWRRQRTAAGFAGGVAVIYLTFFALSKQTFCNYYFLAAGALCCGVAAENAAGAEAREAAEAGEADTSKEL